MYVRLNAIQPQLEEWLLKTWKVGKWSPNAVINSDGDIIDARLRGGLRPSPVTRDLVWGVPVPTTGKADEDEEMKDKVLCAKPFSLRFRDMWTDDTDRCLGAYILLSLPKDKL
jgi:tRNA synthetases class I (M)